MRINLDETKLQYLVEINSLAALATLMMWIVFALIRHDQEK